MNATNWPLHFGLYIGVLIAFNVYWYITYALAIRRGFLDKSWGVPIASLTLNLAWDFYGGFIVPSPLLQRFANSGFMICNLIITWQVFRYWRRHHPDVTPALFYGLWLLAQVTSLALVYVAGQEMQDPNLVEIGFADNLINSALYIGLFFQRPKLEGQSIYIALSKLIGTGAISFSWYLYAWPHTTPLTMIFLTVWILLFDMVYVLLVYWRSRRLGYAVWRRW